MNNRRDFLDLLVLANCAFFLTGAITTLVMTPGATPLEGNAFGRWSMGISYLAVAGMLATYRREVLIVVRRNWALAALVLLAFVSSLDRDAGTLVPTLRRCRRHDSFRRRARGQTYGGRTAPVAELDVPNHFDLELGVRYSVAELRALRHGRARMA